jgi:hypothetical protein
MIKLTVRDEDNTTKPIIVNNWTASITTNQHKVDYLNSGLTADEPQIVEIISEEQV